MKTLKVFEIDCKRCLHVWITKTDKKPVMCPRCKSHLWNEEKKEAAKKQPQKESKKALA